jgi:hypothetical protein
LPEIALEIYLRFYKIANPALGYGQATVQVIALNAGPQLELECLTCNHKIQIEFYREAYQILHLCIKAYQKLEPSPSRTDPDTVTRQVPKKTSMRMLADESTEYSHG